MNMRDLIHVRRFRSRSSRSRAAAVVEFAVLAPLLCTILFGIIEYGYVFLVQQSLTNAAREGCRLAVLQSTTSDAPVQARISEIMQAAGVEGYSVSMSHATAGNPVETINVSVPYNNVSLTGFFGSKTYNLQGTCSMRKEGM